MDSKLSDKSAPSLKALKKQYNIEGKNIFFESGKLWLLSSGCVTMGDEEWNIMLTSAGFKTEGLNEQADFFPLMVDYREKFYATGKIWGNRFQRREARPSDSETLTARLIDRPIRPMFPKGIINDTQILISVLSSTGETELGAWWITSASISLLMTWAPFEWPIAGVNIALTENGKYIYEPSFSEQEEAKLHLIVAGTTDAITMVEAWGKEVSDDEMLEALQYAHKVIKKLCEAQTDFMKEYEKQFSIPSPEASFNNPDESLYEKAKVFLTEEKLEALYDTGKKEFQKVLDTLDEELTQFFLDEWLIALTPHPSSPHPDPLPKERGAERKWSQRWFLEIRVLFELWYTKEWKKLWEHECLRNKEDLMEELQQK